MTEDELFTELAKCTRMENPRDLDEHYRRKLRWEEHIPVIANELVEAMTHLFCEKTTADDRLELCRRCVDILPYDVLMHLNQLLVKREAYIAAIREMNQELWRRENAKKEGTDQET